MIRPMSMASNKVQSHLQVSPHGTSGDPHERHTWITTRTAVAYGVPKGTKPLNYGYQWLCMDIHNEIWISIIRIMDIHKWYSFNNSIMDIHIIELWISRIDLWISITTLWIWMITLWISIIPADLWVSIIDLWISIIQQWISHNSIMDIHNSSIYVYP